MLWHSLPMPSSGNVRKKGSRLPKKKKSLITLSERSRLRLSHQGTQTKFCVLVCVRGRGENTCFLNSTIPLPDNFTFYCLQSWEAHSSNLLHIHSVFFFLFTSETSAVRRRRWLVFLKNVFFSFSFFACCFIFISLFSVRCSDCIVHEKSHRHSLHELFALRLRQCRRNKGR